MLQSIHDNAKGWVAYLIVILISVPFALWGIQEYLGSGGKNIVAEVNGEEIDLRQVQNEVAQQRQRIVQMFGQIPPGFEDGALKRSALESIVNQTLLRQHAAENGYRASSVEVLDLIKDIPAFQKDGQFDPEIYRQAVSTRGQSAAGFEEQLRRSLTNDQFTNAIAQAAFMPRSEMERYQALSNEKRDLEVYTLKIQDIIDGINVSDEQIDTYYTNNPGQFQTEDKVKLAYVELNEDDIAKTIELSDDDLLGYYNENSDRYLTPASYKASRVRISITEQQTDAEAKARAESFYNELTSGSQTIESLAANNTDDTVFVESGETLGYINQGSLDNAVESAILAASAGTVLPPQMNNDAYEIIQVLEVVTAKQQTFDDAKASIEKDMRKEKAAAQYEELFELLRTTAFENDGSLAPSAAAIGAQVKTTNFFSRAGGEGIAANPQVIKAAFSSEVLSEGRNSSLIELSGSHAAVVRLEARNEPKLKELADVKAEITTQLQKQQGKQQLKEKADAILADVQKTGDWSTLGEQAASIEKYVGAGRNDGNVPAHILSAAFRTTKVADKTGFSSVEAASGDFSIVGVTAIKEGDKTIDEAAIQQYAAYIGNRLQSATLKALREKADVKIFAERLDKE